MSFLKVEAIHSFIHSHVLHPLAVNLCCCEAALDHSSTQLCSFKYDSFRWKKQDLGSEGVLVPGSLCDRVTSGFGSLPTETHICLAPPGCSSGCPWERA